MNTHDVNTMHGTMIFGRGATVLSTELRRD